MIWKFCLTAIVLLTAKSYAQEACGRTAIINNQEILVDISSSSKGEGLRPYLERDAVAKSYLDQYQKGGLSPNRNAIIGNVAIGLMLGGISLSEQGSLGSFGKRDLITTGVSLLAINFLIAQRLETRNENLLRKAINEYNKRSYPKIYFLPYRDQSSSGWERGKNIGLIAGLQKSF